jgi:hypothetical protein
MKPVLAASAILLCLVACSPEPAGAPEETPGSATERTSPASASPSPAPTPPADVRPAANVLTLEGLGILRIGQAVPAGSGWAERGAQISDDCRTVSSPDFPGVYAIVDGGKVRRITIGQRSEVKLVEGIGVGATEAKVRAAFPGFREAGHAYADLPAKYLTAPNAAGGDPALRFEIGTDGKVSLVHVGTMPVLGYVEGCA